MPKKINEHIQCLGMDSVPSACDNEENTTRDPTSYTITKITNHHHFKAPCQNIFFFNPDVRSLKTANSVT